MFNEQTARNPFCSLHATTRSNQSEMFFWRKTNTVNTDKENMEEAAGVKLKCQQHNSS